MPKGEYVIEHKEFGRARLPNTYSHWTMAVTGGEFMVNDVQGWKVGKG